MKRFNLILLAFALLPLGTFAQIKVNSAGRVFMGSGTGTTSYGALNFTVDGTTNGISFTGTSANRYNLFKYNYNSSSGTIRDELYITPNQSISKGLKVSSDGGVYVAKDGLYGASGTTALTVCSSSDGVITGIGSHSSSGKVIIKAASDRTDAYAFLVQYRPDWTLPFYVKSDGTVYAKNGYIQSSDAANKEDVQPLENSLDKISALSAVSFYYKDFAEQTVKNLSDFDQETLSNQADSDSTDIQPKIKRETVEKIKTEAYRKRLGLIAQEVEKVVPEVVRTLDDGKKGIMYSDLVSLLIEGIKELKTTVDKQEAINQSQENYIQELEERLDKIEAMINQKNQATITGITATQKSKATLMQNRPNPFNQETEIRYTVEENTEAYIGIYNLNGTQLKKYPLEGRTEGVLTISAAEFVPGIYIYSLIVDNQEIDSKKMVLTD